MSDICLHQMQKEINKWLIHNFGTPPVTDQVLIISEEVGELAHHVLKYKQGIRRNEDHESGIEDAVADIVIGVMAFCGLWGIELEDLLKKTWGEVSQRDWREEISGERDTV